MSNRAPIQPVPGAPASSVLAKVPSANIHRSSFDLSHRHGTNIEAGYLYPLADYDILPGDTFDLSVSGVVQMLALQQQLMDGLHLDLHWFFIPNRLVMDEWTLLMGERPDPDTSIDVLVPIIDAGVSGFQAGTYADFMGYPLNVPQANMAESPTVLALRSLVLTYDTWYRDQDIIDSVPLNLASTNDTMADFPMLRRAKRKDPFTSLRPWPQKGQAVQIPMGTFAPVVLNSVTTTSPLYLRQSTHLGTANSSVAADTSTNEFYSTAAGNPRMVIDPNGTLSADLSSATAVTINALRLAVAMQQLLELFARGGTRYTELMQSLFGVTNPDSRLQRPEFLGGASVPIVIHTTVNSALSDGGSALGVRAGFGHAQFVGQARALHSFTEHGTLLLIGSIRQEYTYWQGLERRHTKRALPDFYTPPLAMLGEQDVKTWEILMDGTSNDTNTIGYSERWVEYRWHQSRVTNLMRPSNPLTLASYHLAQQFSNTPTPLSLSQDFIEENPPISRVVAVPSQPPFNVDLYVNCKAARALPVASVPGLRSL